MLPATTASARYSAPCVITTLSTSGLIRIATTTRNSTTPMSTPPGESSGSVGNDLTAWATVLSAATAIGAVIEYGLLSIGAARTYQAIGVEPREIGLSSGVVLAQTTISIGAVAVLMIAPMTIAIFRGWFKRAHYFGILAAVNLVLTGALVVYASNEARSALEKGHSTPPLFGSLALPSPWHAEIARIVWLNESPANAGSPTCVLYLGTADRVSVLYDHRHGRTLRVPDTAIVVTILPGVGRC